MKTRYLLPVLLFAVNVGFSAELFVKVNAQGNFRATVGGQMQSNYSNIYRFFDLQAGFEQLQIVNQNNNFLFFAGNFNLGQNERLIAEIDPNGNFYVVQREYLQNTGWGAPNYGYGNSVQGNPYGSNPYYNGNGYGSNNQYFQQFVQLLSKEPFDSNKLNMARDYASRTQLSASQIADVAKEFTFDSNRLEWAKTAYATCYDKQNYFLLKGVFTFSGNYNELIQYTSVH